MRDESGGRAFGPVSSQVATSASTGRPGSSDGGLRILAEEPQLDRQQRMLVAFDIDFRSDIFRPFFAAPRARDPARS